MRLAPVCQATGSIAQEYLSCHQYPGHIPSHFKWKPLFRIPAGETS